MYIYVCLCTHTLTQTCMSLNSVGSNCCNKAKAVFAYMYTHEHIHIHKHMYPHIQIICAGEANDGEEAEAAVSSSGPAEADEVYLYTCIYSICA